MSTELNSLLDEIERQKNTYIVPENIRSGITVFGIEGNLAPDKPDQDKTVNPAIVEQTIRPDTGYELASVTVNPVNSNIDANIVPENIKAGVTILGVTGTADVGTSDISYGAIFPENAQAGDKFVYVNDDWTELDGIYKCAHRVEYVYADFWNKTTVDEKIVFDTEMYDALSIDVELSADNVKIVLNAINEEDDPYCFEELPVVITRDIDFQIVREVYYEEDDWWDEDYTTITIPLSELEDTEVAVGKSITINHALDEDFRDCEWVEIDTTYDSLSKTQWDKIYFDNDVSGYNYGESLDKTVDILGNYETFTVTFITRGGSEIEPVTVEYGQTLYDIRFDEKPIRDGFRFQYWTKSSNLSGYFSEYEKIRSDLTLYAVYESVNYLEIVPNLEQPELVLNWSYVGISEAPDTDTVRLVSEMQNTLEEKRMESETGDIVYYDENMSEIYVDPLECSGTWLNPLQSLEISASGITATNLFTEAKYVGFRNLNLEIVDVSYYIITFDSRGGSYVEPYKLYEDDYINVEPIPTKDGVNFEGWYRDLELTDRVYFSVGYYEFDGDTTLYAKWSDDDYEPEPEPEPEGYGVLLNATSTDEGVDINMYGKRDPSNSSRTIFTAEMVNTSDLEKEVLQLSITSLNKKVVPEDDYDYFEGITFLGEDDASMTYTSPISIVLQPGESTTITKNYYTDVNNLASVDIRQTVRKEIRLHLIIHDYRNNNAIMNPELSSVAVNYTYTLKPSEGDNPWSEFNSEIAMTGVMMQSGDSGVDYIDLPNDIKYDKSYITYLSISINGGATTSVLTGTVPINITANYTPDELITVTNSADRRDVYLHICYDSEYNDLLCMYRVSIKDSDTGEPVLTAVNKLYNYETREVLAETHHDECIWIPRSHNEHHYTAEIYADGYEVGTTGWWDEMPMCYRYDRETITPISD